MMVTQVEAVALLTLASGFDNRKPDRETPRFWAEALRDIDYDDARHVIVDHYRTSTDWLMPAHIIDGVRRLEAGRVAASPNVYELEPPAWLAALEGPDFDAAYMAWVKDNARRVKRGEPTEHGPVPVPGRRQLVSS